jgi:hypothetical protein
MQFVGQGAKFFCNVLLVGDDVSRRSRVPNSIRDFNL